MKGENVELGGAWSCIKQRFGLDRTDMSDNREVVVGGNKRMRDGIEGKRWG